MSHTSRRFLFETDAPHVFVGLAEADADDWIPTHYYSPPDGGASHVRRLRGRKMRTSAELFDEFEAVLQFPPGSFGHNWYALEDVLGMLDEWMPGHGYILLIDDAEDVLSSQQSELPTLLKILESVGRAWAAPVISSDHLDRPAIPFHSLLLFSDRRAMPDSGIHHLLDGEQTFRSG